MGIRKLLLALCVVALSGGIGVSTANANGADACRPAFDQCANTALNNLYFCDPSWGILAWDFNICFNELDGNIRNGTPATVAGARFLKCLDEAIAAFEEEWIPSCFEAYKAEIEQCGRNYLECRLPGWF